jgi:hypothetical protein
MRKIVRIQPLDRTVQTLASPFHDHHAVGECSDIATSLSRDWNVDAGDLLTPLDELLKRLSG